MTVDRGTTWPVQYGAHERLVLRQQAKWDRRHLRSRWFWRLLRESDADGTSADNPYDEAIRAHRRYAPPIPVYIYLDPSGRQKGMRRGRVDNEGNGSFGWSRAEARRVGGLLGTVDDVATSPLGDELRTAPRVLTPDQLAQLQLVAGIAPDEPLYLPRSGDIFLHTRRLWEVIQVTDQDYIGETDIVAVWSGKCSILTDDFVSPAEFNLPAPPTVVPPDQRTPEGLG